MKIIGGIKFHKDYDKYNLTEKDVDRIKLKLFNNLQMDRYYRLWDELEKERKPIEKFTLDNKDINYLIGLGECKSEEEEIDTININELLEISYTWLDGFNEEHCGDCTYNAFTCTRCYVERLIGLNTQTKDMKAFRKLKL